MTWLYFLLGGFGLLPLAIVLYKMKKHSRMKRTGVKSTATVLQVLGNSIKGMNQVLIQYPVGGSGETITREITVAGLPYQPGDSLPMYHDLNDPYKMLLDGGKAGFIFMLIFTLLIAIGSIAAAYMINKAVAEGSM